MLLNVMHITQANAALNVEEYATIDLTEAQYLNAGQSGAAITLTETVTTESRGVEILHNIRQRRTYPLVRLKQVQPTHHYLKLTTPIMLFVNMFTTVQHIKHKKFAIYVDNHAFSITWNGSVSDDAHDIRNWTPMATIKEMTLNVPTECNTFT